MERAARIGAVNTREFLTHAALEDTVEGGGDWGLQQPSEDGGTLLLEERGDRPFSVPGSLAVDHGAGQVHVAEGDAAPVTRPDASRVARRRLEFELAQRVRQQRLDEYAAALNQEARTRLQL